MIVDEAPEEESSPQRKRGIHNQVTMGAAKHDKNMALGLTFSNGSQVAEPPKNAYLPKHLKQVDLRKPLEKPNLLRKSYLENLKEE